MRALSIKQPWAWAIIHGGKPVENRIWKTCYRGPLLIHASLGFDHEGWQWIAMNENRLTVQIPAKDSFQRGGIIGIVDMIDCVDHHGSRWFFGPYGFVFENPKPVDFIPYSGKLGLFEICVPYNLKNSSAVTATASPTALSSRS